MSRGRDHLGDSGLQREVLVKQREVKFYLEFI
jgi:hypothetical protein